ncbi:Mbeg1-like protein [Candidatus Enterococcus clewellii]|uniref:Uncharacterized protein n=1 Tax=Candidatus Enterococcus clewellii TaxID=1834193 RepID=A0A242KBP0_9ENTE|nr:Mbeg1-like protein [Enterococcus sp. 9E7_DIV0242]OTP18477.1 hypothetical protein A5888_000291 [Enterococcus sp. 9E7_DIV0242]
MAQPTEEELLILNSIIYTDSFAENGQGQTVYSWANQFDVNSIDNTKKPAEISKAEFATILQTIKNNPTIYENMLINDVENSQYANESGSQRITQATISYGEDLILVYKGTAGDMEWRDNGEGGYYNIADTKQQQLALEYFDKTTAAHGNGKIYVSGHSKGGNKAQYIGVLRGEQVEHTYSFDGQGFNQAFLLKYKELIEKNSGKITSISNELDFVNILLFPIAGNRRYIDSSTSWGVSDGSSFSLSKKEAEKLQKMVASGTDNGRILLTLLKMYGSSMLTHKVGAWHSPYSMFTVGKHGMLSLNAEVEQSELMSEVQNLFAHYVKYMRKEDWRYLCYTLMSAMQSGSLAYGDDYSEMPKGFIERLSALTKGYLQKQRGMNGQDIFRLVNSLFGNSILGNSIGVMLGVGYEAVPSEGYTDTIRDFTQATKDQLLALVEEVEDEPWWDVTKWDVFYRVDKYLLGGIDFPKNSSDLMGYYRKVIDLQGTSASEIHRIFDDVYNAESIFASKIMQRKEEAEELFQRLTEIAEGFR